MSGSLTAAALVTAGLVAFTQSGAGQSRVTAQSPAVTGTSPADFPMVEVPTVEATPTEAPPAEAPPAEAAEAAAAPAAAQKAPAAKQQAAGGGSGGGGAAAPAAPAPAVAAPGWRLVFADDFNGNVGLGGWSSSSYNSRYYAYTGRDTHGYATYDPSQVLSVSGGNLDMWIHNTPGGPVSGAIVPAISGQTYGRYEVTFRADSMPGYGAAFLLWPDGDDWDKGEIDFPEAPFDGTMSIHDHCIGNPTQSCYNVDTHIGWNGWHTATTEWLPGLVTFYIDGVQVGQSTVSPTANMHMVIQTGSENAPPDPSVQGHLQIGSIAIWALG